MNVYISHEEEKVLTQDPIKIGTPFTPVNHLSLSTPNESSPRQFIRYQSSESEGSNIVLDEFGYDSNRNAPPMSITDDSFHIELKAGVRSFVEKNFQ